MLIASLCCVALLVALGLVMGPLMLLDDFLERRRAREEDAAFTTLGDPVAIPAPRAAQDAEDAPAPTPAS